MRAAQRSVMAGVAVIVMVGIGLMGLAPAAQAADAGQGVGAAAVAVAPVPGSGTSSAAAMHARPLPDRWLGSNVTRLPTRHRVVALTLDCGGSNAGVRSILRTLRQKDVLATFFVTGHFARAYPRDVRHMVAAGHRLGNHSNTHPDFLHLSAAGQKAEIRLAGSELAQLGVNARPWFRFPYGSYNGAAVARANRLGYAAIGWTVDTLGWEGTSGGQTARSVRHRVLAAAQPGEIVLMHVGENPGDGSTLDSQALPGVIDGLRHRGYGFVRLDVAMHR